MPAKRDNITLLPFPLPFPFQFHLKISLCFSVFLFVRRFEFVVTFSLLFLFSWYIMGNFKDQVSHNNARVKVVGLRKGQ